jgi:nucleotide-binding universal stress UspA family protein
MPTRRVAMQYNRIMVPLDGSDAAEIVLPYAEEFAAKLGSETILVNVSEFTSATSDRLYHAYLDQVKERLTSHITEKLGKTDARVSTRFLTGKPANEILRHAIDAHIDLIIIASRSSGGGPWALGTVAAKVLRATDIPALLVKTPALKRQKLIRRVLVPLDGSKLGESAVPHVEALAGALGAEVILLHIVDPLIIQPLYEPLLSYPLPVPQGEEAMKAEASAYISGIEKTMKEKGLKTSSVVVIGSPADEIIGFAERHDIDLIAMSSHGRSGIGRWVFGSVTDKVLHSGDTPALVIRPAKK